MSLLRPVFSFIFVCALLELQVNAEDWRGITPLRSSRADVERILKVKSLGGSHDLFIMETERVDILYTSEICERNRESRGYNVPSGTVIEIEVTPNISVELSMVKYDMSRFKIEYTDTDGEIIYENNLDGLFITVLKGKARHYLYKSPASIAKRLSCSP